MGQVISNYYSPPPQLFVCLRAFGFHLCLFPSTISLPQPKTYTQPQYHRSTLYSRCSIRTIFFFFGRKEWFWFSGRFFLCSHLTVTSLYSQYLLFVVVVFFKVPRNIITEHWTTAPGGNTELGSCESLSHNIFTNRSIPNLVLCVFLLKDSSFSIYCWFMNIGLTANSPLTHAWRKLISHVLSL